VRIRRALLPLILVAAAALAACGGDDDPKADDADPSPGATATDPAATTDPAPPDLEVEGCDVLTADEVADVVGAPVKDGVASSGPVITGGTFSSCTWQSDDPDHPADSATVTLYPNTDAADSARGEAAQAIDGLGDQAFSAAYGSVWVYVDDISMFAQWYTFNGTDQELLPTSKALAKAALEAL
jgi:hypothetical protein